VDTRHEQLLRLLVDRVLAVAIEIGMRAASRAMPDIPPPGGRTAA
jgi:hypothetical protein